MSENGPRFVSLMAELRMVSLWERLLMPAFIYFFKMLYPFHLSNFLSSRVAAAAGGCILLETRLLEEIGGFKAIRKRLIDDCALAAKIKSRGYRTWIGLTHSVRSVRRYDDLEGIWNMVARTAFSQLKYSSLLLLLCTAMLLMTYLLPVVTLSFGNALARGCSIIALGIMILSYLPTLRFYRIPPWWSLSIPLAGLFFLGMTWTSAFRYWQGKGSQWKGRTYEGTSIQKRNTE